MVFVKWGEFCVLGFETKKRGIWVGVYRRTFFILPIYCFCRLCQDGERLLLYFLKRIIKTSTNPMKECILTLLDHTSRFYFFVDTKTFTFSCLSSSNLQSSISFQSVVFILLFFDSFYLLVPMLELLDMDLNRPLLIKKGPNVIIHMLCRLFQ